ncbi:hypothetical protein GCM10028817_46240 [Spirosoma pomorum]
MSSTPKKVNAIPAPMIPSTNVTAITAPPNRAGAKSLSGWVAYVVLSGEASVVETGEPAVANVSRLWPKETVEVLSSRQQARVQRKNFIAVRGN